MYCTPCESFFTESQLVDGKCPDCGREVQDVYKRQILQIDVEKMKSTEEKKNG